MWEFWSKESDRSNRSDLILSEFNRDIDRSVSFEDNFVCTDKINFMNIEH